jgi:N-acyl-D-aspartate/D-glutamate deacylase
MLLPTWDDALIAQSPSHPDFSGLSIAAAAQKLDRQPVEALLDLLVADGGKTLVIFLSMSEDDVRAIMRHPAVGIGSDGVYTGVPGKPDLTKPHPRYFGTFPRVIGRYTRDEGVLALPDAVRKMTGLTASILGLKDRGLVKAAYAADLVVFDPETVVYRATFTQPNQAPAGIPHVIVNGVPAVLEGVMTGAAAGRVLRRGA